ncbi:MAG: hypothetical protein Ct9H300mP28_32550 [Pseudomonadota bacterium]|nr:MAG: hypothetical protein Ct9H300mP28_32550 [Pseudomonadota bacterium]
MGQLIDEEECEVCVPFDQEWIFTYGDLVTLLLCFFILLFQCAGNDVEKSKQISESLKRCPLVVHSSSVDRVQIWTKTSKELQQLGKAG